MSWKLVNDLKLPQRGRLVDLDWASNCAMLPQGTLNITVNLGRNGRRPCKLIDFANTNGWPREFVMYHNADGSVSVAHKQGHDKRYVRVSGLGRHSGELLVSYNWDAPARRGALAVECLKTGAFAQANFSNPFPLLAADVIEMSAPGPNCRHDSGVGAMSLADKVMPIGPAPTLGQGTWIMTPDGRRKIETVRLGDLVMTEQNGPQPVRWIIKEDRPTVGPSLPIRLRAPYFGLAKDIVVAASQQVQLPGAHADYLLGKDRVLVEAGQLLSHPGAALEDTSATFTHYQLLLDRPDCIDASGLWVESLFVGQLAREKDLLHATHFAALAPQVMPRHAKPVCAPLSRYEAQSLLDDMVA